MSRLMRATDPIEIGIIELVEGIIQSLEQWLSNLQCITIAEKCF